MTRKELEQVFHLDRELKMWQRRLEETKAQIQPQIQQMTGMPFAKTNKIKDDVSELAILIAEQEAIINGRIHEINLKIQEIDNFVKTLDDSHIRSVIEYRCVMLMRWEEIAAEIGAGYTAESVRQEYSRWCRENLS